MRAIRVTFKSILVVLFSVLCIVGCNIFDSDSDDSSKSEIDLSISMAINPQANNIIRHSGGYIVLSTAHLQEEDRVLHMLSVNKNGATRWEQAFGGQGSEQAHELLQLESGGLFVIGSSSSFNDEDVYAIKTTDNGSVQWAQPFRPVKPNQVYNESAGYTAIETSSGNILIGGRAMGFETGSGSFLSFLMLIDPEGNELWTQIYDFQFAVHAIAETEDDGFVFTGRLDNHTTIVKTDPSGNIIWKQSLSSGNSKEFNNILVTEKGYLVGGNQLFSNTDQIRLIHTNKEGELLWTQLYEGKGVSRLKKMIPHSEGGFLLAGFTKGTNSKTSDRYLAHVDDRGALLWQSIGDSERGEQINDLLIDGDRLVQLVTSISDSNTRRLKLLKTDLTGNKIIR